MVVAMRKKVHGKPMQNILNNMARSPHLDIRVLEEEVRPHASPKAHVMHPDHGPIPHHYTHDQTMP